jgi:hypothetical protein
VDLFPDLDLKLRSVTLAPPVARRLGPLTPFGYHALVALPFLRSHLLGLLTKLPKESRAGRPDDVGSGNGKNTLRFPYPASAMHAEDGPDPDH